MSASIEDFCRFAKRLVDANQHNEYIKFVLCGIYKNTHVVVDAMLNAMTAHEPFFATRDFDSLLGIGRHILVTTQLHLNPIARFEDTLTRDVHITHTFTCSKGNLEIPIHKVPNICLGKWSERNMVRIMLPGLYSDNRATSQLSQAEQTIFYEKGLLPAIEELCEAAADEWPATYNDEMFRARGKNGRLSFTTKVIPYWNVRALGDSIRKALSDNDISWGEGLEFLHQIRGLKHSSPHSFNKDYAIPALEAFLEHNNLDYDDVTNDTEGSWWVDVGLEFKSCGENSLAWRSDAHTSIVERILNIPYAVACRITKPGSSLYNRDLVSHLTAVSGCRLTPGKRTKSPYQASYVQMYCTDKALIYRPDGSTFGKHIKASQLLDDKGPEYIGHLMDLYNNASKTRNSHARLEVRVPLVHSDEVLLNLDEQLVRKSLISLPTNVWWTLRSIRATALKFVLELQAGGSASHRARPSALLLTAAVATLLNSLHSTIDSGASTREVLKLSLPHVRLSGADPNILVYGSPRPDDEDEDEVEEEEEEDEEEFFEPEDDEDNEGGDEEGTGVRKVLPPGPGTGPAAPDGLVFFRLLKIGDSHPIPRFVEKGFINLFSDRTCSYLYGQPTIAKLTEELRRRLVAREVNPHRIRNRVQRTAQYIDQGEDTPQGPYSTLGRRGVRIPPRLRDNGSDVEDEDQDEDQGEGTIDTETDIDRVVEYYFRQFLQDITAVSPNTRQSSGPSYTVLSDAERLQVNASTYQNRRLSDYFRDCQWRYATPKEWTTCFDYLFPKRDASRRSTKCQNYLSTVYYIWWEEAKGTMDLTSYQYVRKAFKAKFDTLYWMPNAMSDRIWYTKLDPKSTKTSGIERRKPSPRILINSTPKKAPLW